MDSEQSRKYGGWIYWVSSLLLCLPLLLINQHEAHDWGGDFAQYLHQAENLSQGESMAETGYIFNPKNPMLGPQTYPPGFPILLTPFYAIWGNDMSVFLSLMNFLLIGLGVLLAGYYRKKYSLIIALVLTAMLLYNPWTLIFKAEVMSEIPFTILLLAGFWMHTEGKKWWWIALLMGFAISFRTIGWTLPLSFGLWMLVDAFRKKELKPTRQNIALLASICMLPLLLGWLFHTQNNYSNHFSFQEIKETISNNLFYYSDIFQFFFQPKTSYFTAITPIFSKLLLALMLIGLIWQIIQKTGWKELWILCYFTLLLIYPYSKSGFRLLLPLAPFLIEYIYLGWKFILSLISSKLPKNTLLTLTPCIFVLILYMEDTANIAGPYSKVVPAGPQQTSSQEAFEWIKKELPADAKIAFSKARVLAFYTGKESFCPKPDETNMEVLKTQFSQHNISHFTLHNQLPNPALATYVQAEYEAENIILLWENKRFKIFERK